MWRIQYESFKLSLWQYVSWAKWNVYASDINGPTGRIPELALKRGLEHGYDVIFVSFGPEFIFQSVWLVTLIYGLSIY